MFNWWHRRPAPEEKCGAHASRNAHSNKALTWDKSDIIRHLNDCCDRHLPAKVVLADSFRNCRFSGLVSGGSAIEMLSLSIGRNSQPATCCVSYVHKGKQCLFVSRLEPVQSEDTHPKTLHVEVPTFVQGPERREALRIPVAAQAELGVELCVDGADPLHPKAIDISITGILVELGADEDVNLELGSTIGVELTMGPQGEQLVTEVCRRQENRYGLYFREAASGGSSFDSKPLRKMLRELERAWLRQKRRSWRRLFANKQIPLVETPQQARCPHCDGPLRHHLATANPPGFGQFLAYCNRCQLYCWYDLR